MTQLPADTRSVTVERELPHPPERVWRALTRPHLLAEWLMPTDVEPAAGRRFDFQGEWGSVACEVIEIEPHTRLAYTWSAMGLESVVTWTLTPTPTGTHLSMEQAGFRADQEQAFQGAKFGWRRMLGTLADVLARSEQGMEDVR